VNTEIINLVPVGHELLLNLGIWRGWQEGYIERGTFRIEVRGIERLMTRNIR
jgi:hypothetical protein